MVSKRKIKKKWSDFINFFDVQKKAMQYIGRGQILFYGGARGGGKSFFALGAGVIACERYPGISVVIIRETLDELRNNFLTKLTKYFPPEIFEYKYIKSEKTAYFKNGSRIVFRPCESDADAGKIQGIEYQFMVIDEANKLKWSTIDLLRGSLRSGERLYSVPHPGRPRTEFIPSVVLTGNPGGRSDLHFKHHFIEPRYEMWNERELKFKEKYIFIPSTVDDNPHITEDYIEQLELQSDENTYRAWRFGDWNTFSGQFFTQWKHSVHVCEPFVIPSDWLRVAAIDEGFKDHPTVCLWAAQRPEDGRLFIYREYAMKGSSTEEDIENIKQIMATDEAGQVSMWFADTSMFTNMQKHRVDVSAAEMYLREGLPLLAANKDRIPGWKILKEWLHWTPDKAPMIQIFDTCVGTIETIPEMLYDKHKQERRVEDLDTRQLDDYVDCLRYLCVSGFGSPMYKREIEYNNNKQENILTGFERNTSVYYNNFLNLDGYERDCFVSDSSYYL